MARYRLRFFFDPGAGICLWSAYEAAHERFGYTVDVHSLPLSDETRDRAPYCVEGFDSSLNWEDAGGPSPWGEAENEHFQEEVRRLLVLLRQQLGAEYEVVQE